MEGLQRVFDFLVILIGAPRPEKAFQAVSLASGDDVHVKMRNTLAHTIIDGDEGTLRLHPLHDGLGEKPDIAEDCANELVGKIEERFDVALYDKQSVAGEERAMIEEGQRNIVLKNFEAGNGAANDLTKRAVLVQHESICRRIFHLGICRP